MRMVRADDGAIGAAEPAVGGDVILRIDLVARRMRQQVARGNGIDDRPAAADEQPAALVRDFAPGVSSNRLQDFGADSHCGR